MIDFPASPVTGQIFTAAGSSWRWDGAKWVAYPPASIVSDVGRNLVHNPLFNIAQRGAGPFTTAYSTTLDRWAMSFVGSTQSITRGALSDIDRAAIGDEAAKYSLTSVCTGTAGAGDYVNFSHGIEDVRRLAGKTITLSFWAAANAGTPKFGINIYQYFGGGGSPSATVNTGAPAITLSTTFTRYSVTIALPSAAGKVFGTTPGTDVTGIQLFQSAGANTNAVAGGIGVQSYTVGIWGVQLEIGSTATPLEKPDPQQDLAKCQRFYQQTLFTLSGFGTSAGTFYASLPLTTMRAQPTVVLSGLSYTNASGAAVAAAYPGYILLGATLTSNAGPPLVSGIAAVSADL